MTDEVCPDCGRQYAKGPREYRWGGVCGLQLSRAEHNDTTELELNCATAALERLRSQLAASEAALASIAEAIEAPAGHSPSHLAEDTVALILNTTAQLAASEARARELGEQLEQARRVIAAADKLRGDVWGMAYWMHSLEAYDDERAKMGGSDVPEG